MQYRPFGKDGWKISVLGFGAMRLPVLPNGRPDEEQSIQMIRFGIDNGINYVDTAYVYHNGESEAVVGKALKDGYCDKVRIATKSPGWSIKTEDDFDRILDEQLSRLQVSKIDYYLFHGIGDSDLKQINDLHLFSKMEKAKSDGRIGHIGFSFHDSCTAFKKIVDSYDNWEFCQIQYNYMDVNNQAGTEGLMYANQKGIPVIIMEPLLGGKLARPPKPILEMFQKSGSTKSPVNLALQWIWNQKEVSVVLSGMSSFDQVRDNIKAAENATALSLTDSELSFVEAVRCEYGKRIAIPCTKCNYCMPCPSQVAIPRNFDLYNQIAMYEEINQPRFEYENFLPPENRASACVGCKACEAKCPQKIKISHLMPTVHAVLGEKQPFKTLF